MRIGADRLERTDAAAPRLEQVVAGRQGAGRDHRAGGGAADANAAERPRQRIADEDALSRHEDALPVRLDQRLAAEVVRHDDADLGELGAIVARLAARAVAAGRPGLQPLERGRLAAAREQDAAERRQVIGDRAVDEAVARHRRDPGHAGELEHHVGPSLERVGVDLLDRVRRSEHRLHPLVGLGPDVAAGVAGVHQVGLALRPAFVGPHAAIDQSLRALDVAGGEQHRRAQADGR